MGSIKNTVVKEVLKIAPYFKKSWRVDLKKKMAKKTAKRSMLHLSTVGI